ncbi:hypothetical protein V5F59_08450 [Xanthobacter autotrophicus DSM 431]|uniref:hypothetical protein n=1 Tax=Xanthobacter nonsaccharivorans TaxID=3119912 RepID=UPI00372A2577
MTLITTHQNNLSSAERRRQLEESTARAMERYRSEFEATRAKTSRLRAEREARQEEIPAKPRSRMPAKGL